LRFYLKTGYAFDLRLFKDGVDVFWYALLGVLLLGAPWLLSDYMLAQLVFVCVFSIGGFSLVLLSGFTGQISLGHAAFLGVGAYTEAVMHAQGVPFWLSLPSAALLAGAVGIVVGLPALRLKGIYLAIATLAFGFIVQEIVTRWESLTGGNYGLRVSPIALFGYALDDDAKLYYLCLALTVATALATINLLRSPTGRAFVAIRDSEISAQCMGINLAYFKTLSFAISAAITGVAGALYAHKLQFVTPEQFDVILSIQLLTMVVIGGLRSMHGAVFGAAFIIVLPQLIGIAKNYLPTAIAHQGGLEPTLFGLILIAFIVFEPLGLHGRWVKIRTYLAQFPIYRRGIYKRQKTYMKSERLK
jgi:branched-chain amino acid transport system permease protein